MGNGGRPTKYKEEYCEQARKLCLLGFTDMQLAEFFEVTVSTIYKWKLDFPEFSDAIKSGKVIADAEITESLYKRAFGYNTKVTKEEVSDGGKKTIEEKHIPGDTTAMIFWLKNRQPQMWRDKQVLEHSGSVQQLSDDEINKRLAELVNGDDKTEED